MADECLSLIGLGRSLNLDRVVNQVLLKIPSGQVAGIIRRSGATAG